MKTVVSLLLCFGCFQASSQSVNDTKRSVTGLVWDPVSNSSVLGANVLQYKTLDGTVVRADGKFELLVPKSDTVLVHISFCFENFYILYLPTENYKEILADRKQAKKNQRVLKRWEKWELGQRH